MNYTPAQTNHVQFIDLAGHRYGRLLVLSILGKVKDRTLWLCRCDCGVEKPVSSNELRTGRTISCGCAKREAIIARSTTHGMKTRTKTNPTYKTWRGMMSRCTNPNTPNYSCYGGRGISVCERWGTFENFLADMGERPDGMSLDRTDNEKGYSPENCRWATKLEQCNNTRKNRMIEGFGKTQTLITWAREFNVNAASIRYRLDKMGQTLEEAVAGLTNRPPAN